MISDKVYKWCTSGKSISGELATDPTQAPGEVEKRLFGADFLDYHAAEPIESDSTDRGDLQRAFECGKWGNTRPSDLFLQVFHDVLLTIDADPMVGMTSPALLGTSGVIPLTIIGTGPDICRHMSNCIARAEADVFLATNYWIDSENSNLIANSIRELSKRAGERGKKAVVKVMYDRGDIKQVWDNHRKVSPSDYSAGKVKLPHPDEIPNVDMEVVNYHRPILGTFHCKFMIVDRKIAIVSSNNIQDNDNFEMMSHLEGPIVDSFYDMCLASWHNALKPPLPTHNTPASQSGYPSFDEESHAKMFNVDGTLRHQDYATDLPEHTSSDPHYDPDIASEVMRAQSVLSPKGSETRMQAVTRHLNTTIQPDTTGDAPECDPGEEMMTYIPHPIHDPFPMAMVCRKPFGAPNHSCLYVPQNEAFLSAIRNAKKSVFIQTPNLNAEPLLPALISAAKRGVDVTCYVCLGYNDAGELLPFQGGTNEIVSHKLHSQLQRESQPQPQPQDLSSSSSSSKEDHPAPSLQPSLHLHIHNYTAKDQTRPIHNTFKRRSAHIKLLIVDSRLAIQGNANQDTQSYFHSQEANVMIDSEAVCRMWEAGIRRNQNTHLYGRVSRDHDGCWVDEDGRMAEGALGTNPAGSFGGVGGLAKGLFGALKRVRGVGGF